MKSQVALKYLIIVGVVLASATTLYYYSMSYSSESVAIYQTKESTETLAKAIVYVYALGPGSHTTVLIELPPNIVDSYVVQNEIGFSISV